MSLNPQGQKQVQQTHGCSCQMGSEILVLKLEAPLLFLLPAIHVGYQNGTPGSWFQSPPTPPAIAVIWGE